MDLCKYIQTSTHYEVTRYGPCCIKFTFEHKSGKSNATWVLTNQNRAWRTRSYIFFYSLRSNATYMYRGKCPVIANLYSPKVIFLTLGPINNSHQRNHGTGPNLAISMTTPRTPRVRMIGDRGSRGVCRPLAPRACTVLPPATETGATQMVCNHLINSPSQIVLYYLATLALLLVVCVKFICEIYHLCVTGFSGRNPALA